MSRKRCADKLGEIACQRPAGHNGMCRAAVHDGSVQWRIDSPVSWTVTRIRRVLQSPRKRR